MNILTFDIEEWFHSHLDPKYTGKENWSNFEVRIYRNMELIHRALKESNTKATFFCIGWIARKHPDVIKEIDRLGYEIGTHSDMHEMAHTLSPTQFKNDFERSIKSIEDLTGKKIRSYRAPGFSITNKNLWAFDTLIENGITVDCSIFPASRDFGGLENFGSNTPCIINYKGVELREFPMNFVSVYSKKICFSGGGYFRFIPYNYIKKFTNESEYVMAYFHPRDFDPGQPFLWSLPVGRKFKSYVGLKKAFGKFQNYLNEFEFLDIAQAEELIDWDNVKRVNLSDE